MKALLLLFLIYINYAVCFREEWMPKKPYPKKVIPEINRNLHLRRFIINNAETTKLKSNLGEYTVFPLTGGQEFGIPNSPYFPFDDHNPKRELFQPALRKKREAPPVKAKPKAKAKPTKVPAKRKGKKTVKKAKKTKKVVKPKNKRNVARKVKAKKTVKNTKAKKKAKVKSLRRLIAAKDAQIDEYPYTVSIQKGRDHWCSGALLNQRMVITTANCVWKLVSQLGI